MQVLVTGVAGFVGSHLAERLLADGHYVVGVDAMTSYYNTQQKAANLDLLLSNPNFQFVQVDLTTTPVQEIVDGCDIIFHQAAQPGVRSSWGTFSTYVENNIVATQKLLEAAKSADIQSFVYASSSSIYGNATAYPTLESFIPQPHSPYGVTKLSAEHLVSLYAKNWSLPTVSLRYFTVYGPRQRPDMAIHRLIESCLRKRRFPMFGDGRHVRDFTYVGDIVEANIRAATLNLSPGTVMNTAGGASIDMKSLIQMVGDLTGEAPLIEHLPEKAGDVERTGGDISLASELMAWSPQTTLEQGLEAQIRWHRSMQGRLTH